VANRWAKDPALLEWRAGAYVSAASPVVVGGCPRSGTTLLRVILDSHAGICCGPEANVLHRPVPRQFARKLAERFDLERDLVEELYRTSASQAEFVDRFFAEYAQAAGKPRWAEKTPKNVLVIDYLFEHFPKAKFIHVIRDGRDVVCSLRTHPRHRVVAGVVQPVETRRRVDKCARVWRDSVTAGTRFRGHPSYAEVRYEQLVAEPETTLRALLEWLGEPWDEAVLRHAEIAGPSRDSLKFPDNPEAMAPISRTAVGRWRTDLTAPDLATVEEIAGELLSELGYA
jgi:hypothetical protein